MTGKPHKNTIKWHDTVITREDRARANGHRSAVIWLTGLPSAGKSSIAVEIQLMLFKRGIHVFALDGDNVRHGLNKNLGFSPADRSENIRRIGEVSKLFIDAGILLITSFISPYKKDRDSVRELLGKGDFIEVYIKTSIEECERRDPKGNYAKARTGEIKSFTGISAPYEVPEHPEIVIDTERHHKEESAKIIVEYLENHGYIPNNKGPERGGRPYP